jgi:hypothetical protein
MMTDAPEFRFSETWCARRSDRNALHKKDGGECASRIGSLWPT